MITNHYDNIAHRYYRDTWFEEIDSPYQSWLISEVLEELLVEPHHQVVDIGAGTGYFSSRLAQYVGLSKPVLCVEPSVAMFKRASTRVHIQAHCMDACHFSQSDCRYDRLLIKETIHHISPKEYTHFFSRVFKQLLPGGILLIITRSHDSSNYPFFSAAHHIWAKQQPPTYVFTKAMHKAGFITMVRELDFPVSLIWYRSDDHEVFQVTG